MTEREKAIWRVAAIAATDTKGLIERPERMIEEICSAEGIDVGHWGRFWKATARKAMTKAINSKLADKALSAARKRTIRNAMMEKFERSIR